MSKYHYAHTSIAAITDQHLQGLFDEIRGLRDEPKEGLVIQFLTQSLHPFPIQKKKRFDRHDFLTQYYLVKKVGVLKDTEIYKLCIDLVSMFRLGHIENFHGVALYVFLNRAIPDSKKRAKR
jgi:hypothetical protein